MRISTTSDNDLQLVSTVPEDMQHFQIFGSEPSYGTGTFGRLFFQRVKEKRYTFWLTIYQPVENTIIHVQEENPWLGFRVMLKHHIHHIVNGSLDSYLKQGQFNFGYSPTIESKFELKKGMEYCTFDMLVDKEIFNSINRSDNLLDKFLRTIKKEYPALLFPFALWCNAYSQDAIENLMKYPRDEFLAMQVIKSLLETPADNTGRVNLTESNIEAICHTRDIIRENVQTHTSIKDLAKKSGINSRLLKTGFFHIFRKTPYQYLLYERLKLAKQLLDTTDLSIQMIAERTGFHFDTSLIKAFKKEFHQTPHAWRKTKA